MRASVVVTYIHWRYMYTPGKSGEYIFESEINCMHGLKLLYYTR